MQNKRMMIFAALIAAPGAHAEGFFDHNYARAGSDKPGCAAMVGARYSACVAGATNDALPPDNRTMPRVNTSAAYQAGTGFGVISSQQNTAPATGFGVISGPPGIPGLSNGGAAPAPSSTDYSNPVFATPNYQPESLVLDENYYEDLAPDLLSGGLFGSFSGAASKYVQGKIQDKINGAMQGSGIQPPGVFVPGQGYYNESDYAMYSGGNYQPAPTAQSGFFTGSNVLDLGPSTSSTQYYEPPRTISGWSADTTTNY